MISKLLIASAVMALATASCPNDCSQHGLCNQYSACECYRNWMGADCSERVCPFGHAFIDTPQGDLNADGRVDRPDVMIVTITGDAAFSSSRDWPANVLLFDDTVAGQITNILESVGASIATAASYDASGSEAWNVPIISHDGAVPEVNNALKCGLISDSDVQVVRGCETLTGLSGHTTFTLSAVTEGDYTYNTQFSNSKTWELYPANHAAGKDTNTLTKYWDEAHFYSECSGKGMCNRGTGECECFPGFTGAGCARTACPNDCSGHGVCSRLTDLSATYYAWDRNKTQACVCDSGYEGIDCSQRKCPSGDDPITRSTEVPAGSSFFYVNSPHAGGQEPEIQTFGTLFTPDAGNFALEFTDEFGDKWVTETLGWDATAAQVESALEALPNSVVEDVIVHKYTGTDEVSADAAGPGSVVNSWTITFIKNSGDVANLGVRYTATVNALNSGAGYTETDNGGQFRALSGVTVDGTGSVTDDKLAEAIGVCAFRTCASDGLSEPTSTSDQFNIQTDSTQSNPQIVFHTTGRPGSQENSVCSNRGLCDYSSGLCKCFNGFTDDDCSRQNALAMY